MDDLLLSLSLGFSRFFHPEVDPYSVHEAFLRQSYSDSNLIGYWSPYGVNLGPHVVPDG
jgi:hypothetical protein